MLDPIEDETAMSPSPCLATMTDVRRGGVGTGGGTHKTRDTPGDDDRREQVRHRSASCEKGHPHNVDRDTRVSTDDSWKVEERRAAVV
jgi:hypothetical protein